METPLVKERKLRGREMVQREPRDPDKKHLMYEGYEGNKKYLVPDSNLQVMKELVEMRLSKPPRDRYLREYELVGQEKKVESEEDEKEEEVKLELTDKESAQETTRSSESASEFSSSTSEESQKPQETVSAESDKLRFLLSGHIRDNLRPIFIIHKYNGQNLFGEESADFKSAKTMGEVDLFVSGKFYHESILKEVDGVVKSLIVKPKHIIIDERTKIYENAIHMVFRIGKSELEMDGTFIKQPNSKKYTPFLTFNVAKAQFPSSPQTSTVISSTTSSKREPYLTLGRQVVYFVSKPKPYNNIFNTKPLKRVEDKSRSENRQNLLTDPKQKANSRKLNDSQQEEAEDNDSFTMKNYRATVNFSTGQSKAKKSENK